MGGRLLEGPTMVSGTSDWKDELGRFLKPFLDRLGHKARQQMCHLYVSGLIRPGDRKSIQPMAEQLALGEYDQLHRFISAGVWDATPVETELLVQAVSNGTNETGDGFGGDRSCHRGGCAFWLRVGGCRLWAECAVPPGAHSSQTCLGGRCSASPQS